MKEQARLESILIHSDCHNDDLPLAEHLQNGNRIEWTEAISQAWAALAIAGCIIAKLLT